MSYTNSLDNPELYFQTKLYTGNGGTQSITLDGSENMQPDWVWIKNRSASDHHSIYDSVRGANKVLFSSRVNIAETTQSDGLTSFDSDGFSIGADGGVNTNSNNFVSWNWKAGTSFTNDASSTGIGTIDSTGSASDTAGFSIVSYTGNNTSGATFKHGLSTAPSVVILKNRNLDNNRDWIVYHTGLTSASYYIYLNSSAAQAGTYAGFWNNTAPNSSVITLGSGDTSSNGSGDTYIAYCFAEKKGYSKFGSYTGNGNADGTFTYLGFKPAFLIIKATATTDNWTMYDNKRPGYNSGNYFVFPNLSNAEDTSNSTWLEFFSNGFKVRATSSTLNTSGNSYIYMAFAESPFVNSNGIPNNAR